MQNKIQSSPAKKSLYVFLTTLLGALLFFTIQRAAALVSLLLVNTDYGTYSFNVSPLDLHAINVSTILLAVFFGGWYGVWLGLHWYEYVYETEHKGWFYGLTGNLFNHGSNHKTIIHKVSESSSKPVVAAKSVATQSHSRWELDDLLPKKSMDMQAPSKIMPSPKPAVKITESKTEIKPKVASKKSTSKAVTKTVVKRKTSKTRVKNIKTPVTV